MMQKLKQKRISGMLKKYQTDDLHKIKKQQNPHQAMHDPRGFILNTLLADH